MNKHHCHCSGHARGRDLLEAVSEIDSDILFPIHTEHPELYKEITSKITLVKESTRYDL